MAMVTFKQSGNFSKTKRFLKKSSSMNIEAILNKYGKIGVQALSDATPVDSRLTADSWYYKFEHTNSGIALMFNNSNVNKGVPIAIILQYGHGTGTGGYVEGRDYINPAIQPVFDEMAESIWKEVTD